MFSITDGKDEVTEYDSSSDDEICKAEDLVEESASDLGNQQITRDIWFSSRGDISIWSTSTGQQSIRFVLCPQNLT